MEDIRGLNMVIEVAVFAIGIYAILRFLRGTRLGSGVGSFGRSCLGGFGCRLLAGSRLSGFGFGNSLFGPAGSRSCHCGGLGCRRGFGLFLRCGLGSLRSEICGFSRLLAFCLCLASGCFLRARCLLSLSLFAG